MKLTHTLPILQTILLSTFGPHTEAEKSLRARFFRLFSGGYVGNTHIVCVRVMYFDNSKFFPSRFSQHQKDNRRRWVWVGMMCCI